MMFRIKKGYSNNDESLSRFDKFSLFANSEMEVRHLSTKKFIFALRSSVSFLLSFNNASTLLKQSKFSSFSGSTGNTLLK